MKIPHSCTQCWESKREMKGEWVPLVDDGVYYFKCEEGHEEVSVLQVPKYQVLFHYGLNAIIDGYYRDAVSSTMASLEKFYEFYMEAVFLKNGHSEELISKFKSKTKLSERKLGAFISAYVLENKKIPETLNDDDMQFRNQVIHDGRIPTNAEVISWAEKIQSIVLFFSGEFLEKHPESFAEVEKRDLINRYRKSSNKWPGARIGTMSFGTPLTFFKNPTDRLSVKDALIALSRRRVTG